jgi:ketosteroid isomerase-like protein
MTPRITALILWTSLAAQGHATEQAAPETRGDARASLFRADNRLSQSMMYAGPVSGLVKHAAGDITYLHPDADIVVGKGNTQSFLRQAYAHYYPNARTELHRIAGDTSADGTLGYTFGWLDELKTPKNSTVVDLSYGRYVAVWRRRDRDWELEAFLRISSTAQPPAPPADALILDGEPGERVRDHADAHALAASIADARFADHSLAKGYSEAFDAYAADAAIFVSTSNIYWNRAGVNLAFSGWTPDQSLRWHPLRAGAAASGDLAWTVGHGNFWFGLGSGAEGAAPSKYLTLWLRTADGWRFLLDCGNARPADPLP